MLSYLACCVVACTGLAGVSRTQEEVHRHRGYASQLLCCTVPTVHSNGCRRHTWQRNDNYDNDGKEDRSGTRNYKMHCDPVSRSIHSGASNVGGGLDASKEGMALLWDDTTTGKGGNGGIKKSIKQKQRSETLMAQDW